MACKRRSLMALGGCLLLAMTLAGAFRVLVASGRGDRWAEVPPVQGLVHRPIEAISPAAASSAPTSPAPGTEALWDVSAGRVVGDPGAAPVALRDLRVVQCQANARLEVQEAGKRRDAPARFLARVTGTYTVRNDARSRVEALLRLPLPGGDRPVREAQVLVNGQEAPEAGYSRSRITWKESFGPGEQKTVTVSYQLLAEDAFLFVAGARSGRIGNLTLELDIAGSPDQPVLLAGSIEPDHVTRAEGVYRLAWDLKKALTQSDIGVRIPPRSRAVATAVRTEYVPWAGGLFTAAFVLCLYGVLRMERRSVGWEHYPLLGVCHALFYPLLYYSAEHLPLGSAYGLAAATSALLVLNYLRGLAGMNWALRVGVPLLGVFLGFFGVAMVFPSQCGLLVVLGVSLLMAAVTTLFPEGAAPASGAEDSPQPAQSTRTP